jgi:hypothetical protein
MERDGVLDYERTHPTTRRVRAVLRGRRHGDYSLWLSCAALAFLIATPAWRSFFALVFLAFALTVIALSTLSILLALSSVLRLRNWTWGSACGMGFGTLALLAGVAMLGLR